MPRRQSRSGAHVERRTSGRPEEIGRSPPIKGARMRRVVLLAAIACLVTSVLSGTVFAQQASGIAGTVRDVSGAVLPGVSVEAASPALIERVRVAVSDGEGR